MPSGPRDLLVFCPEHSDRVVAALRDGLAERGVAVTATPDLDSAALSREDDDRAVACLVVGGDESHSESSVLDWGTPARDRSVPVVRLLGPDAGLTAPEAIYAGATATLRHGDPPTGEELALLVRRVERALDDRGSRTDRRVRSALATLSAPGNGLVAVFDEACRHEYVTGKTDDREGPVRAEALADRRPADALPPEPGQYVEADYAEAVEGSSRDRTLPIGDAWYRVETRPFRVDGTDEAGGGVARYEPLEGNPESDASSADVREKIERLHDFASELEGLEDRSAVYETVVEFADRVLEFDACAVLERDENLLRTRAVSAPKLQVAPEPFRPGEGLVGKSIAESRSFHVGDVRDHPEAKPTDDRYRSALSIPLPEDAAFQAVSTTVDAYSEADRELAELLCTHAGHALERIAYERAITDERDRFAALFENVPDAAVQYAVDDGRLRIERVNATFARMFGVEAADAVGLLVDELLVPDSQRDDAEELHRSIVEGERLEREVRRGTGGETKPFLLRSVPVASEGTRPAPDRDTDDTGYLIYTDVSALKERERDLRRKNERLDEFASIVSHDLRNPLQVAQGHASIIEETGETDGIESVRAQLDRIERLIDDVLTLARKGKTVGTSEPASLETAATEAWQHVATESASLDVGDLPVVEGDPQRLQELFENLFRNAISHGGSDVTVTVGTPVERDATSDGAEDESDSGAGDLLFYVDDDGAGIPPDSRERVFDDGFSTADDGTGLGMTIVERIANAHDWTVDVTKSASGGARFEFRPASGGD